MTGKASQRPPTTAPSAAPGMVPAPADPDLLAAIVAATRDLTWVVDSRTHELLWWNQSVALFHGERGVSLKASGAVGEKAVEGMRAADLVGFYRRTIAEGPFETESELAPGVWLALHFAPLYRDGVPYAILVAGRDVTQRKRAEVDREEALRRLAEEQRLLRLREEEQRLLLMHAPAAVFEVDLSGPTFVNVNGYACEATGYSRDELLALSPLALVDDESRPRLVAAIQNVAAGASGAGLADYTLVKKDGGTRSIVLTAASIPGDGRPRRALAVGYDVTDQKLAQDYLQHAEEKYRTVVDNIQEGVLVCSASGDKLFFNDQLPRMLGYTNEEYAAAPLMALVHPEDRSEVRWMQAGLFQSGSPVSEFEARLIDKDGRVKWVRAKASLTEWLGQQAAVAFLDDVTAQVQAEAALKQSVDIVNSMFKSVQDAFYMATVKEGRFLEFNHAFETLFGYSRDEAIGATSTELGVWVDPAERAAMIKALQAEGRLTNYMAKVRRKDGQVFSCTVSMAPCDIDGTACIVGFLRDETERLAAENSIKESEARYRLLADNIADVIWMADMDSLRFTYVSPSCFLLDGYTPDELVGTSIVDRASPGMRAEHRRLFLELEQQFAAGSEPFLDHTAYLEILHKDGTPRWVEVRSRLFRDPASGRAAVVGMTQDKSRQRAVEMALREKQEQLDRFFSLEVGLLCVTDLDCRFRLASAGWEKTLGYSKDDILGRSMLDLVHHADRAATLEAVDRLRAQEEVVDLVNRLQARDGSYRTISWRCAPAGELVYSAARDVTELLAAEEQLRQSQKMEAIGQLAGGIAHDFNNLLTAILGYTDLLLASPDGHEEPLRLDLLEIKGAAKRAADLTHQILAFSRKQALRPEIICINDVLMELKPLLERLLGENVMLEVQTAAGLGQCEIDPSQFTQVLINLVVNARDAMPQGGFLILETANAELTKGETRAALADLHPGSYVLLTCRDTGTGMDAETVSRIFEPFFTTKAAGLGTGLGLSTVHGIVHQSGGTVVVESEIGHGTTFSIYLPRAAGEISGAEGMEEPTRAEPGHGKILVVEDEVSVAALADRVLSSHGYTVTTASESIPALAFLTDPRYRVDLLLTDMVLPGGMQGGELAETARTVDPALQVLYMSGYSRDSSVHGGCLDETVNFLQKPFTPKELVAKVEETLDARERPARAEALARRQEGMGTP